MKIAIKYPRKKFIEAENVTDLQKELKILMIEEFDIKNFLQKPFSEIKNNILTKSILDEEFEILINEEAIIIPTVITQCKI